MAGRGEHKASGNRLAAAERQRQALDLRKAGATYRQIAQTLGYGGPSGAEKAVKSALRATLQEPADELRTLEVERLDALWFALWPAMKRGEPKAVAAGLRVMERRAALLGLDAPRRVEQTGKDGGPIRHEHAAAGPDFSALSLEEQFALDQMLAKVEAGGAAG